ncbi:MAG: amino acid adenylation domain-containing protein [Ketobacteraceae bacterium]|nr:amino acid adenylation domain-containing protein [Ketobacteraceae bacterium]
MLLSALALTLAEWSEHNNVLLDLEGHGREHIADSIDVSRTVGWFTSIFPLILQVEQSDLGEVIKSVKEQMRAVPMKGMSYGLLRYLHNDQEVQQRMAGLPEAQISFNYLGQLDKVVDEGSIIRQASENPGQEISPACERHYALEVSGRVQNGQLKLAWRYSTALHHEKTVRRLSDQLLTQLTRVIEHCIKPGNRGYTPSDFPLANLDQSRVDTLFAAQPGIQAVYPLSPVQEGMLFHSLYEPGSWVYFDQVSVDLGSDVNEELLFKAWEEVISRHDILRTGFLWEGVRQPLQVVHESIDLPLQRYDWSRFSEAEAQEKLARFMVDDRNFGFNFRKPGVLRLTWIKLPNGRHQLIWSFHHILLDGWSMPVVFKELFACYEQLVKGNDVQLPGAPRYQDFIGWLQSRDKKAEDEFWSRYLSGFSAPTPIPLKNSPAVVALKSREEDSAARYCEREIKVSGELLDTLQSLAKEQRLTLNHVLQGVWGALLNRYSGEEDVLYGTTVSGRPADLAGVENMVGLFINTLPLRMFVDNDLPFMEWLQRVQDQQVEMKRFESSSLVDVQKHSQVSSKQALFESILVFENYPIDESLEDSQSLLDVGDIEAFQQTNFPLTLVAIPGRDLIVRFSYDSHLFEHDTIDRMLSHIEEALKHVAKEPEVPVGDINILSGQEREKVLHDWNHTFRAFPDESTLAELFESVVARHGDLPAAIHDDRQLSYRDMNRQANRLAHYLIARGLQAGQPVATCFDRSFQMLVSVMAILKAGGAYVPIDPSYPEDRVKYMLDDTRAPVLLVDAQYENRFGYLETTQVVNYQDVQAELSGFSEENPNVAMPEGGNSLALIVYTSGSTGKPKGVLVPQRGAARMAINTNYMDLKPGQRLTHAANLSFDATTFELWAALLNGCALVIVDKETVLSADAFSRLVAQHKPNLVFLTTALFHVLSKQVPSMFAGLDYLMFGGEACDPNLVRDLIESEHRPKRLMNFYGPAENSTYATYYEIREVLPGTTTIPIGYPVGHSTVYILDSKQRPVPFGVPGEIYCGGKGVAKGYQNRPDLTAAVFMDDPYCEVPGYGMYKTGDLGRMMPNGEIEILGRADDQVKIRGFRIELGEIETALTSMDSISDTCVVARQDQAGNKQLVAYCESPAGAEPDVAAIRAKLKQMLPDFMVPAAYVFMDRLPITPNGKFDKRALPDPDPDAFQVAEYVAPRNNVEEAMVAIWQDVLGLPQVGIYDDFFELGGHSLLITKVSSRIKEHLNVELPLRTLFEVPTIAALAEIIATVMWQSQPQEAASEETWDDEDFEEGTL